MSDSDNEKRIQELSQKADALIFGYKLGAGCLLVFFSLLNFATTFVIPNFRQIFLDALGPDHPLPILTNCILATRYLLPILAILWPVFGLVAIFRSRIMTRGVVIAVCMLVITVIQFVLTVIGLFSPMVSLVTGMNSNP